MPAALLLKVVAPVTLDAIDQQQLDGGRVDGNLPVGNRKGNNRFLAPTVAFGAGTPALR